MADTLINMANKADRQTAYRAARATEMANHRALGVNVDALLAHEEACRARVRPLALAEYPVYERAAAERKARSQGLRLAYVAEALFIVPDTFIAGSDTAVIAYAPRGK